MRPVVVVTGSLNMDFVVRVKRFPSAGKTVHGHSFQMFHGGKGANQACAAARLGAESVQVKMAGRVGVDAFGDRLKAGLAGAGVDVSAISGSRSQPTGIASIAVDEAGENTIVVAAGANAELEPLRSIYKGAAVALFQLETPIKTVAAALQMAREEGARTILDPAPAQPLPREILDLIDFLTPNETEAELAGALHTIVKMGSRGCRFEDQIFPAFPVNVVDTTGAGDTFNGAFAVALAEGLPIPHALQFANAAAALSVTRKGAQASVPSRAEVDELLRQAGLPAEYA